ncbi:VOC family protein [Streptomyces verrucosisporus]|uniref:VOC family protein n=1 Tax=Streptomyces verrucosisporus TaxID=1695161 RepID=UPI003558A162
MGSGTSSCAGVRFDPARGQCARADAGGHRRAVYVVSGDVDAVHQRVVGAGGEVLEAPHKTRFGPGAVAYVRTVQDPEGDLWTFGTYRGPSPEWANRPDKGWSRGITGTAGRDVFARVPRVGRRWRRATGNRSRVPGHITTVPRPGGSWRYHPTPGSVVHPCSSRGRALAAPGRGESTR